MCHASSTGENMRIGLSFGEWQSFIPPTGSDGVSGTTSGVWLLVWEKIDKNDCPHGVDSMVTMSSSETWTVSYQPCGSWVFSHSWNRERETWERKRNTCSAANSTTAGWLSTSLRLQAQNRKANERMEELKGKECGKSSRYSNALHPLRSWAWNEKTREHHCIMIEMSLSHGGQPPVTYCWGEGMLDAKKYTENIKWGSCLWNPAISSQTRFQAGTGHIHITHNALCHRYMNSY